MKTILLVSVFLLADLVSVSADTSVTVTTKAPVEQLAPDGSVSGVSMATLGTHYTLVRYQAVGVDGKPVVVVSDSSGQQYRISVAATDYQQAPAAAPTNAPPIANVTTAANTPPAPTLPLTKEADVTTLLDESGLSARFDRLMTKFATVDTRHLSDQDRSDGQAFGASFSDPDKRSKYQAVFIAAAAKDYSQFSSDDVSAINTFLGSSQAAAETVILPAKANVPGSIQDIVAQAVARNDYRATAPFEPIITSVHATLDQLGIPAFVTSYVRSVPQKISDGEIDGIGDGLLTTPSYAGRADEIKRVVIAAKRIPAKSKYQQNLDNEIDRQEKIMGRPPIIDDTMLRQREEEHEAQILVGIYTSTLSKDQAEAWKAFATSPAGKKFYALRADALQAVIDAAETDWYQERHDAAKKWAQGSPDEAYSLLNGATPPSTAQTTNTLPVDDNTLTKFIVDAGLDTRLQRAVELAAQAKPRQLDDFDGTATQSFASGLKVETYTNDCMAAAHKAYATFTPDDLAAIAKFLADPIAKASAAATSVAPPVAGSMSDIWATAKGPPLQQMEMLSIDIRAALKRDGLAAANVAFVQGIPKSISDGELDGLAAGLFASPAYASRTADVEALLNQAKEVPARSATEQSTLDQLNQEMQREGRPPLTNPVAITKAEIDQATIPLMEPYATMLSPDQVQQWEDFANSPTGKKFYAFRIAVLAAITSDLEKDWYSERYTAARTWAQGTPDAAYAMLKNLAAPQATP